jgi:DNA repair protein RadC
MEIDFIRDKSLRELQERWLRSGVESLSDIELLILALKLPLSSDGVLQAESILLQFGSLNEFLHCDRRAFCQIKGFTLAKFSQMQALLNLHHRAFNHSLKEASVFKQTQTLRHFVWDFLQFKRRETFYVLFLDSQHRLLADEVLFEGTINAAFVYPREIVKRSLELDAVSVILAHNHPLGNSEPSLADRKITQMLQEALDLVDIRVLDHFVVGEGRMVSFFEWDWL